MTNLNTTSLNPRLLHFSLLTIFIISFFGDFLRSVSSLAPPLLAADFGASDEEIGIISGAYGLTYCFTPILFGRLSDKIGRRNSIFIAFVMYSVATILYMVAKSVFQLFLGGIIEGIALAFLWPAVSSLIVELSSPLEKNRNIDKYMSSWNLGAAIGPFFAGFMYQYTGYFWTIFSCTLVCMGCVLIVKIFLRVEKGGFIANDETQANSSTVLLGDFSKQVTLLLYIFAYAMVVLSAFYLIILSSYFAGYSYKYQDLSPTLIGFIVFCLPIGRGISFSMMSKISNGFKLKWTWLLTSIAFGLFFIIPTTKNILFLAITFICLGFISGFGFSGGFSIITEISQKRLGLYTGIAESMVGISFFISPTLPFLIFKGSPNGPFWLVEIVLGGLLCIFLILRIVILKKIDLK